MIVVNGVAICARGIDAAGEAARGLERLGWQGGARQGRQGEVWHGVEGLPRPGKVRQQSGRLRAVAFSTIAPRPVVRHAIITRIRELRGSTY